MNKITLKQILSASFLTFTVGITGFVQSCAQVNSKPSEPIQIDGSSTVFPLTEAVIKEFQARKPDSEHKVDIDISGTTGGFEKFCEGKTQISQASRPINEEEIEKCHKNQVRFIELPIAFDALVVVVNPKNNWVESISVEELKKIWQPEAEGKIKTWKQVNESWPDKELTLFGADKESGTFDYFTEAIVGKTRAGRTDYVFSEDDNTLVNGVAQDSDAMGYFGYSYYQANQSKLKALAIDNGKDKVLPSIESVQANQYHPLARPLILYINLQDTQNNPALRNLVEFYINEVPVIAEKIGFIPLNEGSYHIAKVNLYEGKVGTVFGGKIDVNATINELLVRQTDMQKQAEAQQQK